MRKILLQRLLETAGVLTVVLALFSYAAARSAVKEKKQPALSIPDLEKKVHALINQERKKHGLPALEWNNALSKVARGHSEDMAKRNYFSHVSPDGHAFSYRYEQEGFSCRVEVGDMIYGGAENIFQNNLYDKVVKVRGKPIRNWTAPKKIAKTTVDGWMNSPGHRKNILIPYWKSEGIGIAVSPDGKVYITQNFC